MTPEEFKKYHNIHVRKKRGRPRMTETFFYNPNTRTIIIDPALVEVCGKRMAIWVT